MGNDEPLKCVSFHIILLYITFGKELLSFHSVYAVSDSINEHHQTRTLQSAECRITYPCRLAIEIIDNILAVNILDILAVVLLVINLI